LSFFAEKETISILPPLHVLVILHAQYPKAVSSLIKTSCFLPELKLPCLKYVVTADECLLAAQSDF